MCHAQMLPCNVNKWTSNKAEKYMNLNGHMNLMVFSLSASQHPSIWKHHNTNVHRPECAGTQLVLLPIYSFI